jgi:RES domain
VAASSRPTADFAGVNLDLTTFVAGERFRRIYFDRHKSPLGFGKTPSRFSDPRRRKPENRFGVLYLGETLRVCFLEAVLRDKRNGTVGDYPMDEIELRSRQIAVVEVVKPLATIDLRGDGGVRMGVPSDVSRASDQRLARAWSAAFHDHPARPDGIVYSSRLNGQTNLAIYDRAIPKLRVVDTTPLIDAPELPEVLDELLVALVP